MPDLQLAASTALPSPALAAAVLGVAAVQAGAAVWALHAALRRTMAARGWAGWRVRDTLLVSPLLAGGLFVAAAALDWVLVRLAAAEARAQAAPGDAWAAIAVAAVALVVAAFGRRAVGKLY